MEATLLYPAGCILGESPMWDDRRGTCCWVDIEGRAVYEMDWESRAVICFRLQERISLVVPGRGDYLVAGLEGGIFRLYITGRIIRALTDLGITWNNLRCNDGACDSMGRLWVGTTDLQHEPGAGAVYCVGRNREVSKKIDNVTVSNGMAWSPDNKRLYFTDSITRQVSSFLYGRQSGDICFEKTVIAIPEKAGLPDGMAMDVEGKLWVALWGGHGVGRFDVHTGEMINFIDVPVPRTTSCCFAGPLLDQLVITTARTGMTKSDLDSYPDSGNVFVAEPGVRGMPRYRCGL